MNTIEPEDNYCPTIEDILDQRGKQYNKRSTYTENATTMQHMKGAMRKHKGWIELDYPTREAFEMVIHKMVRVLGGDDAPDSDSRADIIGFMELARKELAGE